MSDDPCPDPYPHVVVGWRFLPGDETSALRQAGVVGEIIERGIDGHPDMVRAVGIRPNGERKMFGERRGGVFHVSTFAHMDPAT